MPPNQNAPITKRECLRIAIIGQSPFAVDVVEELRGNGHMVVGIFTVKDKGTREDALAKCGREFNIPVFKFSSWRKQGKILPEVFSAYKSINADLNVLPYCSQFIPMEVINYPRHKTIVYHPSILPRHRGASAINWTLICGDAEAGLTIFWADDGLDTGPILLQEKCRVQLDDTVDSLYSRFLYPVGVTAVAKAVELIAEGDAPSIVQTERGATYDAMLNKPELYKIDWKLTALQLHNFIRGMDSIPGATCTLTLPGTDAPQEVSLFGSNMWSGPKPDGDVIVIEGGLKGLIHSDGLLLTASDGQMVNVKRVKVNGRMRLASKLTELSQQVEVKFTPEEQDVVNEIRKIWESILSLEVDNETDFFACGAGSMDVVRLVEEVKDITRMELEKEDVFMSPSFIEFASTVILKSRGFGQEPDIEYKALEINANKMNIRVPSQLFIGGKFVDSKGGKFLTLINPTDETVIGEVSSASIEDVNMAVSAAKQAFENGEWTKISARERGRLLFKLADLMEQYKEELATIESIDSGAVYTLALKTHIGMSIETWRYFAGWCDKIHGTVIPVTHARPSKNLSFTKKEPIGVCGLVTPWNYPLMMLSWKMAACLAAGNTVIIKPAQVCPLTALKFAELTAKAGIPPGVVNVLPGTGSVCGNAIANHPEIRKMGFTGSTEIGKVIMRSCADSNLKKVSLELGGKSPLIIFADCDMDKAVKLGMQSVFFNKGENCIAAGRLFVEDSIHDEFIKKVVRETAKMAIGDPLNRSTSHGPQNHLAHFQKLLEYIEIGKKEGATLVAGGNRLNRPGYFLQPAIFTDVTDDMYIAKEESFGPIMVVSKFDSGDVDGVLRRANASEYGLAAGVFTKDISKALRVSEGLHAGTVFVNTYNKTDVAAPFGGFKQSGFGKDLGQEALNEYLVTKCITVEY